MDYSPELLTTFSVGIDYSPVFFSKNVDCSLEILKKIEVILDSQPAAPAPGGNRVDPHAGALVPRGRRIQRAAPTAADPEKKIKVALKWGFELTSASIPQLGN